MRMGMRPDESRRGGSRNFVRALTRFSGRKPPDRPDVGCDAVEDRTPLGGKNRGGTSRFLTSNWQGKVKAKENNENLRQASGKGPKRKKFFLPSRRACCLLLSLLSHFCFCRSCGFLPADWERTVQAAQREGELVLYASDLFGPIFGEFQKKYPRLKVSLVTAGGGASNLAQRLLMERRANRYLGDIWISGVDTAFNLLLPGKALDAIRPALILPEILDESNWWQGKHHYVDPEHKFIFIYEGSAQSGGISYKQ